MGADGMVVGGEVKCVVELFDSAQLRLIEWCLGHSKVYDGASLSIVVGTSDGIVQLESGGHLTLSGGGFGWLSAIRSISLKMWTVRLLG